MHQFKIEVFVYTAEGAVGELETTRYADNAESARLICNEYSKEYQIDAEGNKTANKKYKVNLHMLCYKAIADKDAFFAQFQA